MIADANTAPNILYPSGCLVASCDDATDLPIGLAGFGTDENLVKGKNAQFCEQKPRWNARFLYALPDSEWNFASLITGTVPTISYNFSGLVADSTSPIEASLSQASVEGLFDSARYEIFEDGMESKFSRQLARLIARDGDKALEKITGLVLSNRVPAHVVAETLRWFGLMRDPETQSGRLWLLARCLQHKSPVVRDGAIVGLGILDDRNSKTYVEIARQNETNPELKKDLDQLLNQLNEPEKNYALSFKGNT